MMLSSMLPQDNTSHTQSQAHDSSFLLLDRGAAIYCDPENKESPQLIDNLPTTDAYNLQKAVTDLSSAPMKGGTRSKRYVQTKEDWEFQKATIINLYGSEDRSLKDVMQIMASRYDFHATVKMYKSRLNAWSVRKYMTWAERENACQSMGIAHGKNNELETIVVGGRPRNRQVFLRHKRKVEAVSKMNQSSQENLMMTVGQANLDSQTRQLHVLASTPMYPAGPEKIIEMVCRQISSLVVAAPSRLAWTPNINPFIRKAGMLARYNKFHDVRMMLEKAESCFKRNIVAQPAGTFLCLLQNIAIIKYSNTCAGPFAAFYRCLFEHIRCSYGPQHSLTHLGSLLFRLGRLSAEAKSAYEISMNILIDKLRYQDQQKLWYMTASLATTLEAAHQHEKAISLWLQLADACEQKHFSNQEVFIRACCFRIVDRYLTASHRNATKGALLEMPEKVLCRLKAQQRWRRLAFSIQHEVALQKLRVISKQLSGTIGYPFMLQPH